MELFNFQNNPKLAKVEDKINEFHKNEYNLIIVSSSNADSNANTNKLKILLNAKMLFQMMLPKMPKEYILRQVFDKKHCVMILTTANINEIIGAICYRPAFDRNLVEIVFLAINSINHISGYGTFLVNCLKETIKYQFNLYKNKINILEMETQFIQDLTYFYNSEINKYLNNIDLNIENSTIDSIYMLTYADNSAIGFFKKQGFSLKPRSTSWIGFIKDYDGGTLMESKVNRNINYLNQKGIIVKLGNEFLEKFKNINSFDKIVDINDDCPEVNTDLPERNKNEFLFDFINFLITDLESNPSAWPFLAPVNIKDVPDYFLVIKKPMDLSRILEKHKDLEYLDINLFIKDVFLMINNCYTFNSKETQYYKCAENLEKAFLQKIDKYKSVIEEWGHKIDNF